MAKKQKEGGKGNKKAGRDIAKCARWRANKVRELRKAGKLDEARRLENGNNHPKTKSRMRGPLARNQQRIYELGEGWNHLAPYNKRKIQNPVAIVALVHVGGDIHFNSIPVVGVAWDKRVGNEVRNAPKSGMYHIEIVDY